MPSEANKIRQQCAQKFGVREKRYRERIEALEAELATLNTKLEDYNNMKRAYVKMVVYCGLSEKMREKLMRSRELEEVVDKYAGFLGIVGSAELQELASAILNENSSLTISQVLEEVEKRWSK